MRQGKFKAALKRAAVPYFSIRAALKATWYKARPKAEYHRLEPEIDEQRVDEAFGKYTGG